MTSAHNKNKKILIVGGGPTGLTAAIELYRRGYTPRIIDRKSAPSPLSRAVGINARSLELLEDSGVTAELLKKGHKLGSVNIHEGEKAKTIGTIRMDKLPHKYNFLLALPQNETEQVMSDALVKFGGKVEYGHQLTAAKLENGTAKVQINGGAEEEYDLVIAADGAHSKLREDAGIAFKGYDYKNRWSIADFESKDWPDGASNLYLLPGGHVRFVVRIGEDRYRAVADQLKALDDIPVKFTIDKMNRADDFVISIRQAETYQKPPLYLAGDAAHVHSPAGGRGMNMGIEDAYDLARRIAENDLDGYTAARHPVGAAWLKNSERMVAAATAQGTFSKLLRRAFLAAISAVPSVQKPALKNISGLKR